MALTREQTQKAVEELKANEWVALGGMSPEAQEFARGHKNEAIWFYKNSQGNWHDWLNGIHAVSYQTYRLDPSYTLPEEEGEYLEFDVCQKFLKFNLSQYDRPMTFSFVRLDKAELFYYQGKTANLQLEGYKFEGDLRTYNYYHGWQENKVFNEIRNYSNFKSDKKVFANKVVYRKVG